MKNCKMCSLSERHPGVSLDSNDLCNLCKLEVDADMAENFRYTADQYQAFLRSPPNSRGPFDCLLMYSGGKDSTYMLDKFVREGKRVLAYTFDVPFESARAIENAAVVKTKLNATFFVDKDDKNIKRMMQEVFNRPRLSRPGRYLDEKLPCISCRTFFLLRATMYAFEHEIPYIVLCADPQQILTMESNVRKVVRGYYRQFGAELLEELFGSALEALLFAEDERLPTIVFPFVAMRHEYNPEAIASELKAKGLYSASPIETHCQLFPLLNYYSFKNWDCMFYKLNASSQLRSRARNGDAARATYSGKFADDLDVVKLEERLRNVLNELATGEGDRGAQERVVLEILKEFGASGDAAKLACENFLNMRAIAAENGIALP